MKKKGLLIVLSILMIFLGINNLSAATLKLKDDSGESFGDSQTQYGNSVFNKRLDGKIAYCISGFNVYPINNDTCTATTTFTSEQRQVIGQIINNKCSDGCPNFGSNYATTETTIFEYLRNKLNYNIESSANLDAETEAQQIYDDAIKKVSEISSTTVSLSSNNLNFTIQNGYYISNTITVTNSNDINNISFSAEGAEGIEFVKPTTNSAYIKIPVKNITKVTTMSLTVTGSKNYPTVEVYDCIQGQDVVIPTTYSKSGSKSLTGTITPLGKLTINKYDNNKKHLAGATIKVTGPNGYSKTFETEGKAITLDNLEYGTYTIEETKVPDGYVKEEKKTVTLSSSNYSSTVDLVNTKIRTIFSKLDATGGKELPGAFLEIQDKEGKIVKLCPGTNEEKTECKWVSTDKPYEIEGLPIGKYYLVETIAPDKYVLSKEKVEFEITGEEPTVKVEMKNKLNKVKISKISLVDKKELPGATLEIQDKEGKVVEFCTDANGKANKPCIWVSSDEPYEIKGMPNGTYYLIETMAPEGFVLSTEKIEFVIDGNEAIVEVEMGNELEVKVPDTLSSRSTLLIAISMFDIALGIGILTYVKKNKVQE